MRHVDRQLGPRIAEAAKRFPAVIVTGPRRSGKTTLLRRLIPGATYVLLEDPDVVARVRADPREFLAGLTTPAILDEIQNVPELFAYVRTRIDGEPRKKGQWFLTGSQESPLMGNVTESLAGRAAVFQLLPLSTRETPKVTLLHGGFPEVVGAPKSASTWFSSYVQTYLERDVRSVLAIRDLSTYRRFIALVASRVGQVLNKTDLAAPLGVSIPTITQWLGVLEITGQILLVPPYFENFGKRLVKSPKIYFGDTGLLCHLLGISTRRDLERSTFLGALFECFVASELVKTQIHAGHRRELYFFRDHQGLEVDFVLPHHGGRLFCIEAKAGATVHPADANSLLRLAAAITTRKTDAFVVHQPRAETRQLAALREGAIAGDLEALLDRVSS